MGKKQTNLHMDQIGEENKHIRHPWSKLYEDIGFRKDLRLSF
jgi:hypothetical protein